jgi:hypothetical protein
MKVKSIIILLVLLLNGCIPDEYEKYTFKVTWDPCIDVPVNSYGGGYIVQYGEIVDCRLKNINHVEIPYEGGQSAPTEATITAKRKVDENTSSQVAYSVQVIAYGQVAGKKVYSAPSKQAIVYFY